MAKTVSDITPQAMQAMGDLLKSVLPDGVGFSLIIFDVNREQTHFRYVSNGQRQDMLKSLRELLAKWEREAAKGN